jgi:hypothetical protein
MGLSQNPQTVTTGFGTEIWDITGESVIVVEPYEQVDKLLNPAQDEGLLSQAQLADIMRDQYGLMGMDSAIQAPESVPAAPPAQEAPKTPEKRTEPHKAAPPKAEDKRPQETAKTTS